MPDDLCPICGAYWDCGCPPEPIYPALHGPNVNLLFSEKMLENRRLSDAYRMTDTDEVFRMDLDDGTVFVLGKPND